MLAGFRTVSRLSLFAALIVAGCQASDDNSAQCTRDQTTQGPPDTPQYLFVQDAETGTFSRSSLNSDVFVLTLQNVDPVTTFFSDRPYRQAGYIDTKDFVEFWNDTSDDSFLEDPPNAALQLNGAAANADVVVLELVGVSYAPEIRSIKYSVRIVQKANDSIELFQQRNDTVDQIPESFGSASLFIDSWYSKAWHKVKHTIDQAAEDAKKAVDRAQQALDNAVGDLEKRLAEVDASLKELAADPLKIEAMSDVAFHQLVSFVLPKGIGKCLDVVPGPIPFTPIVQDLPVFPHRDWMNQLSSVIGARELGSIAIPGSHDSGTYTVTGASPLTTELAQGKLGYDALLEGANGLRVLYPASFPIINALAGWSRAQRHSIAAQLVAGVRYFDLRIIPDPTGTLFFATHAFAGDEIVSILAQLKAFLTLYPKEVVILDFQHLFSRKGDDNGMSQEDAETLAAQLFLTFPTQLVTDDGSGRTPKTVKLSELWNAGKQVVAIFDGAVYPKLGSNTRKLFWSGETDVKRYWPQATSWSDVEAFLDAHVASADTKEVLSILQGQITPTPDLIKKRMILLITQGEAQAVLGCLKAAGTFGELVGKLTAHLTNLDNIHLAMSLEKAAAETNPNLRIWLQNRAPRHVVIADFIADQPELIDSIIRLNQ